ncbi:MAG: type II toxin-antitoxin system VapC family toxin [Pelovirga sp.]
MSYLIDTNVISELRRTSPEPDVVDWFSQRPACSLFLSVLTLGEIRKGIEKLKDKHQQIQLLDWLENDLLIFFSGRILSIDSAVADRWGRLVAGAGRTVSAIDSLLAATAVEHDLILITRNIKDVEGLAVTTYNPWQQ